jgi:hypothetical protein
VTTGEQAARLQGHTTYVWLLAFSPDGATLASGSGDHTVRSWDTAPLKLRYQRAARPRGCAPKPIGWFRNGYSRRGTPMT